MRTDATCAGAAPRVRPSPPLLVARLRDLLACTGNGQRSQDREHSSSGCRSTASGDSARAHLRFAAFLTDSIGANAVRSARRQASPHRRAARADAHLLAAFACFTRALHQCREAACAVPKHASWTVHAQPRRLRNSDHVRRCLAAFARSCVRAAKVHCAVAMTSAELSRSASSMRTARTDVASQRDPDLRGLSCAEPRVADRLSLTMSESAQRKICARQQSAECALLRTRDQT